MVMYTVERFVSLSEKVLNNINSQKEHLSLFGLIFVLFSGNVTCCLIALYSLLRTLYNCGFPPD